MLILYVVQRKYESEIGESMEKPKEKLKKILIILGITGAVYAGCKYLLPLVIPFFAAYGMALLLEPSSRWLSRKLSFRWKGKSVRVPIELIGGTELLLLLTALSAGIYWGGQRLLEQAKLLMDSLPEMTRQFDRWLTGGCRQVETALHLRKGYVVLLVQDMLRELGEKVKTAAMPYLMVSSVTIFQWTVSAAVILLVVFLATVLTLGKLEAIRDYQKQSLFREEFELLHQKFAVFGKAFLRVQGVILLLTCGVCTAGLWLMGNPYYVLLGIGIGLLDALPLLGTGTVLLPWAAAELFGGYGGRAVMLVGIYVACYLIRQILETKMMAKGIGLSALETLASLYVGLQLFGALGVVLGPLALMLLRTFWQILEKEWG